MNVITTTDFRKNMAQYLDQIKIWNILYLWRRKRPEFVLLPTHLLESYLYPGVDTETNRYIEARKNITLQDVYKEIDENADIFDELHSYTK